MKQFFITLGFLISFSSFAQNIVTAEKNNEGADLCFHKQVQLEGYAYANIIGRCAWDPAMNGMYLTVVAVPEDPTQDAHTLALDNVRDVKVVQNKSQQLQITVVQDNFDSNENVVQKIKVIYVRTVNPKKAQFSIKL
jgi:hypothetical protein